MLKTLNQVYNARLKKDWSQWDAEHKGQGRDRAAQFARDKQGISITQDQRNAQDKPRIQDKPKSTPEHKAIKQHIINNHLADTVGTNKAGNIVARHGYFYRHGNDEEKFANRISESLKSAGIEHEVVDKGDHWAPFRGGASVAQGSHFTLKLDLKSRFDDSQNSV